MNILHDHERAAGMGRGGHVSPKRAGAQKPRRYGAIAIVFNAALFLLAMPALAKTPEVLAFGDSLTAGYGLPASQAFPARLQARLKSDGVHVRIGHAGVSGDTTSDGLARLDWALAAN